MNCLSLNKKKKNQNKTKNRSIFVRIKNTNPVKNQIILYQAVYNTKVNNNTKTYSDNTLF